MVVMSCGGPLGQNLYPQGDFGTGNSNNGTTDPGVCPGYDYEYNGAPIDSFYTLNNNTANWTDPLSIGNWKNTGDQSPDPNGYMLVVNLLEDPHVFLVDSVQVCAGINYQFSFDALNLIFPEHIWARIPDLEILINGQVAYDAGMISQDTTWHHHEFTFSVPTGTTCIFEFRNKASVGLGGDLALDNIEIASCLPNMEIESMQPSPLCEFDPAELVATFPIEYDGFEIQWQSYNSAGFWQDIFGADSDTLSLDSVWLGGPLSFRYELVNPSLSNDPSCMLFSNAFDFDLIPRGFSESTESICEWSDRFTSEIDQQRRFLPKDTLYIDTLVASTGCDSIVHLRVFTFYHETSQQKIDLCEGDTAQVGNSIYTESGFYTDTLDTFNGCDSVIFTEVNLLLNEMLTLEEFICEGDEFNGIIFFNDTTLLDTLLASNGCLLFQETNIHAFPNVTTNVNVSIQEGEAFMGEFYTSDQVFIDTLETSNGCDSIVTTYLEVRPDLYGSERIILCEGESFQNMPIYTNTTILDTLESSIQSDSFIIYDIRVLPQDTVINTNSSCELINDGIIETVYTNQFGCDSLVIDVNIYLGDPDTTMLINFTCDPMEVLYEETLLQNQRGCDSLVISDLRLALSYETINEVNLCEGELYNDVLYLQDTIIFDSLNSIHGCDSVVRLNINVHPIASVTIEASESVFCQEQGFSLTAQTSDQIQWSTGSTEQTISLTTGGLYVVEAQNQFGCTAIDSIFVNDPVQVLGFPNITSPSCLGQFDGQIEIFDANGGSAPYLYSIDGFNFQSSPLFSNISPDIYEVFIEDSQGCQFVEEVVVEEPEPIFLDLGDDLVINEGEETQFQFASNIESINSMSWYPSNGLNCLACKKPKVSPRQSTTYTLTITDENGCTATDEVYVEVIASFIFIPTVFSPNGDGINDFFTIFCDNAKVASIQRLKLFDRWGTLVFDKRDFQHNQETEGWNGKHKGKYLQAGVFIFETEILLEDGTVEYRKGDFMLSR